MKLLIDFPIFKTLNLQVSFSETEITQTCFFDSALSADTIKNQKKPRNCSDRYFKFAQQISDEFTQYLSDPRHRISLPCGFQRGTLFQQRVWRFLTRIPAGQVKTYGELAKELNTSARAVGNACRQNPFPVVVPCHRVVSASDIGGFAGDTPDNQKGQMDFMQIKKWLLNHEQTGFK